MAFIKVLACIILSFSELVVANVPVLLWESSVSDKINSFPALQRIRREDFQQYILKKVHGEQLVPLIAVFSEESLSMEDFSWQDSQGQGYFPQLKYITENAANVEFLPSVQAPIEATKQLSEFGYSVQSIDSSKTSDLPDGCSKVLIINLQEAKPDEDRPDLMRGHDMKISEIYSQLLSKCSHVIGILSGAQSSWVEPEEVTRVRRAVDDNSTSPEKQHNFPVYYDNKVLALLYSSSFPNLTYEGKTTTLGNTNAAVVTGDTSGQQGGGIKLMVKYGGTDYRLVFRFDNRTSGYWYLRSLNLEVGTGPDPAVVVLKRTKGDIYAPLTMSWHSGSKVIFSNSSTGTTLTFSDLQVQPFFLTPGSKVFSEATDEERVYFTPAIWSGVFVTFLLALIFTWGLSMIMDIRTMDQFDDPKGKTITVSATE